MHTVVTPVLTWFRPTRVELNTRGPEKVASFENTVSQDVSEKSAASGGGEGTERSADYSHMSGTQKSETARSCVRAGR